ncbi:hypothetical protein [Bacillus phage Carmen17]|uniref:Uncharacterized protein n=1 Tax=Bacillus phage Carmen17 TaxID=2072797 RepID=A0A2I7QIM1_9CAUD|nr:hypothetical protein HWB53_gp27 [Bacillus phage Carmen17]AUR81251.1 hypothetical protein [Bacillus phage Carmen17]
MKLNKALQAIQEKLGKMEVGDKAIVMFKDAGVIVEMDTNEKGEKDLKVNIDMDKPTLIELDESFYE